MGIENSKTPQITLDKKRNLKKIKNTSKKHSQILIQRDINKGYFLGDKDPFKIIKNISNRRNNMNESGLKSSKLNLL